MATMKEAMITVKLLESTRQNARMIHAMTGKHLYQVIDELVKAELQRLQDASFDGRKDETSSRVVSDYV